MRRSAVALAAGVVFAADHLIVDMDCYTLGREVVVQRERESRSVEGRAVVEEEPWIVAVGENMVATAADRRQRKEGRLEVGPEPAK